MHLRKLQAVLGLGGPCQSSSQGRRADRADGVVHLHSGSDLVSPDGSSIAPLSVPALVHQEGRTIVRRYVDDPEAGQLPGKNPTTASRTVWPENLDRPGHRASQPNRVSDTSTEDPASSTSSRSIRRGEFHPPGRSRTPSKSTKRELRNCFKNPSGGSCSRSSPTANSGTPDGSLAVCRIESSVVALARPKTASALRPSGSCPTRSRGAFAAAPSGPRSVAA